MVQLVVPAEQYLPSYSAALRRGWSPDNERGLAASLEELEQMWIDKDATGIRDYGELSNEELLNYWLPMTFDLWQRDEPNIYMVEEVLILVRDFQVWTDEWMPIEVAQSVGVADKGYGVDYVNAEFVYQDLDKFKQIFEKSGFQIKVDEPSFMKLLKYL